MPFKLGAASRSRPSMMFMKTGTASWCEHAPSRGLVLGVAAMTVLMSVTAVSALFILPHMGKHETAQDARQADAQQFAEPARDKITTITAEPTGRKNRLVSSAASILVSEANAEEAVETPLAADPRWSQVVAASANKPLEAIPAVPGAEKVIATGPIEPEVMALAGNEDAKTDPAATAAIKAMDSKPGKDTRASHHQALGEHAHQAKRHGSGGPSRQDRRRTGLVHQLVRGDLQGQTRICRQKLHQVALPGRSAANR